MSGRLPRAVVRTLARIETFPIRSYTDEALHRVAWLTVWHAAHGAPDPFQRALAQLRASWGFRLQCELEPMPEPETPAAQPTVECVEGRSGDQWLQSAIDYLRWRQGLNWRRYVQRREPTVEICSCALHLLTQLQYGKHDGRKLPLYLALRIYEAPQLVLRFPARPKSKTAAA